MRELLAGLLLLLANVLAHLSRVLRAGKQRLLRTEHSSKRYASAGGSLPSSDATASLIRQRRSIFPKDYVKGAVVGDEEVALVLEAANWAPTHGKTEPWRFTVLASHEARLSFYHLVQQVMESVMEPQELQMRTSKLQSLIVKKEPVLSHLIIITCRRAPNMQGKLMPEWEDQAAVACAVQNLHLQATAMSISGYWSSFPAPLVRESPRFKQALGYEQDDICMGIFFLGRSNTAEMYRAKRGPISEKVTWKR